MAARIGVLAIRGDSVQPLIAAFRMLDAASAHVDRGWAYARVKLDDHPDLFGPAADTALAGVNAAALQAWIDGDVWYLAVHRPGRDALHYVHFREYLDDAYEDATADVDGTTLADLIDEHENALPGGWSRLGPDLDGPVSRLRPFLFDRAQLLCDALDQADIPHDREVIAGALTGYHVTPAERVWSVANFPRVLEAIDLHDIFPEWRIALAEAERAHVIAEQQAAEAAAEAAAAEEAARPVDYIATLVAVLGDAPPAELDRPIVAGPTALWLIPWACHGHLAVGLIVKPCGPDTVAWPAREGLSIVQHDDAVHLGFTCGEVWEGGTIMTELATPMAALPDGTQIELLTVSLPDDDDADDAEADADVDPPPTAGNMRFRGAITGGEWRITHVDPKARADDLERALAIFTWCDEHTPFETSDADEAEAILALAAQTYWFHDDDVPTADGATIEVSDLYRPHLAMIALRHRLADGPWDVATGQQRDAAELAGWEELTGGAG